MKQAYFPTLNDSLISENLLDSWDDIHGSLEYGETKEWTWDNGTRYGHFCSVYRDNNGRYERPVHYAR